jgi:hypothetical protein
MDKDGEPERRVRRSGGNGQLPEPGQDLGKQAVARRELRAKIPVFSRQRHESR